MGVFHGRTKKVEKTDELVELKQKYSETMAAMGMIVGLLILINLFFVEPNYHEMISSLASKNNRLLGNTVYMADFFGLLFISLGIFDYHICFLKYFKENRKEDIDSSTMYHLKRILRMDLPDFAGVLFYYFSAWLLKFF